MLFFELLPCSWLEREGAMFAGLSQTEMLPVAAVRQRRAQALQALLDQLGYGCYRVEAGGELTPAARICDLAGEKSETDFLAVHSSRRRELEGCAADRLRAPVRA